MDYRTKVTVLSALLGLLTLTAVLGVVFSGQSMAQRQAQEALLPGFQADLVTSLELPKETVLTRTPAGTTQAWALKVSGQAYPAAPERVTDYLKALGGLRRERLVGRSVALAEFGLDAPQSVLVKDKTGRVLFEILAGKSDASATKVYVQLKGSPEVWETDAALVRPLQVDFNTWADLTLAPGKKPSDLTRLTYTGALEAADKTKYAAFDLVKGGTPEKPEWTNQLDKSKPAKAVTWVNQVASYRFGVFFSPGEATAIDGSGGKLVLEWGDNTRTEVTLGARDAQNRYPATDGQRKFWVYDWSLSQLLFQP
ncbi:MAG: DUF4340 domain-containing protein [Spirochaetales bacterium]